MESIDKWQDILGELREYGENWDGEGARAIQTDTIRNCEKVLEMTSNAKTILDDIFPTELGTVCIQWHKKSDDTLVNAEICPDRIAFYAHTPGKPLYDFRPTTFNDESVNELVSTLNKLINEQQS